jgi:hypothetical protein
LGEEKRRQDAPHFRFPQPGDFGVVGRTFVPAIPTVVVAFAVAVVLAVGFIVLLVVGNQVVQSEAIVARDKIDAGVRPAAAPFVEVAGAREAGREFGNHSAVAFPESADRIAVLAVPFRP